MKNYIKTTALASVCAFGMAANASAAKIDDSALPSREEMWEMIKLQNQEIQNLKSRITSTEKKVVETDKKAEEASNTAQKVQNLAPAGGSAGYGWWENTSIGGYGELHLNKGSTKDEIDFHRFVLFVNHEFTDDLRLYSEVELEHSIAGEGQVGEFELEQAFLEYDINDYNRARAGVFLLPVGILNETHEPPTFFGVERNPVESNIIPSTWWEGGVGFSGELGEGFSYDVALHSGLNVPMTGGSAYKVRNGRSKVGKAQAEDGAVTGRLKWTGYPGVEIAATAQYQSDVTQSMDVDDVQAGLFEIHTDIERQGFGLRALYARWVLDGSGAEALGRDVQEGFYIEPSYTFEIGDEDEFGIFARYNYWDNEAGNSVNSDYQQVDIGFNYWPHPDVVLKADMAFLNAPAGGTDDEIANLGVGFAF
ncbi:MAG: porin [Alphaproteobacteria bacterium CG11_big_fil_rev_8_21_14_0_20_44_7]|nr:MAG: porin [Alphaproteobacteria bacterium CG11_big_fil_rev_8_21_14_0_20_44_7]